MMKHEQQTSRLEKSPHFFGGNNFLKLNLYEFGVPDLVHWNNGLHDSGCNLRRGPVQFSIGDYLRNLEEIYKQLQATGAKIIWATTTPVSKIQTQIPFWSFSNN